MMVGIVLGMVLAACGGESVFSMEVGLCFNDEADAADEVSSVPDVPCEEPHDNEVFALVQYSGETFPGAEAMQAEAADLCIGQFEAYVGLAYEESELDVYPLVPTQASWDNGDREIVCALYALDLSELTGSMKGAAR
ncbi:MAG: septum formation family protein [Acidimicrobiia bacterium]